MKRLVIIVAPAILLVGLVLLDISDTNIAIADTGIRDSEATATQTEASNSCAIAMVVIPRITPSGEGGSNGA